MIAEVKTFVFKPGGLHFDLTAGVQGIENAPVFAQGIIYFADIVAHITVEPVVVATTALIRAEFFISPALKRRAAFNALFLRHAVKLGNATASANRRRSRKPDYYSIAIGYKRK